VGGELLPDRRRAADRRGCVHLRRFRCGGTREDEYERRAQRDDGDDQAGTHV
jgi:hypothetical protein